MLNKLIKKRIAYLSATYVVKVSKNKEKKLVSSKFSQQNEDLLDNNLGDILDFGDEQLKLKKITGIPKEFESLTNEEIFRQFIQIQGKPCLDSMIKSYTNFILFYIWNLDRLNLTSLIPCPENEDIVHPQLDHVCECFFLLDLSIYKYLKMMNGIS